MRFTNLLGVFVLTVAYSVVASGVQAQTTTSSSQPIRIQSIPDAFNQAFFHDSGTYYYNTSVQRQIQLILGVGSLLGNSFPDNEVNRDAQRVEELYRYVLRQQNHSGPILRTPDQVNPFDSSLQTNPTLPTNNPSASSSSP